mmetsp:Transcript_23172/g.36800  ORF Transcript_23172/g.36800 Transcript_23172/m.36800 type:complete len:451 (-) Transcript_23172:128-1480(-)
MPSSRRLKTRHHMRRRNSALPIFLLSSIASMFVLGAFLVLEARNQINQINPPRSLESSAPHEFPHVSEDPLFLENFVINKKERVFKYGLRRGGQNKDKPGLGIAFLKTPKCGGTTVATVLANLVLNYGLKRGEISFGHHTMSEFKEVEHSNGQAVGLVREPGSRFQSAWTWRADRLRHARWFSDTHGCRAGHPLEWAGLPDVLACCLKARESEEVLVALRTATGPEEVDRMAHWHTGIARKKALKKGAVSEFKSAFHTFLVEVVQGKHLVLVLERLEESLVLLRHAYGLGIDDIIHLSDQNVKHGEGETRQKTEEAKLREQGLQAARALHHNDRLLYEVANNTLDRWLQELGPELVQKDLAALRDRTAYFMDLCSAGKAGSEKVGKCLLMGKTWSEINQVIKEVPGWKDLTHPNNNSDEEITGGQEVKRGRKQKKKREKKKKGLFGILSP